MTREVSVDENPGRGLSYALITTAIGRIGIAWSDRGVVRLQLPESDDATTVASLIRGGEMVASPLSARMVLLADALECYGRGERRDFSATPLDLSPPLELNDYSLASLERAYPGYTPTVELQGKDRTLLVLKYANGSEELYDHYADPLERTNVDPQIFRGLLT